MPASKTPGPKRPKHPGNRTNHPTGPKAPFKLNRKVIQSLADVLEKGVYIETAAAFVGIHKDTFYDWLKRGRRDINAGRRSIHRELVDAVETALAKFEVAGITRLEDESQWQATAWRLERRFPDKYGRRSRVDHANADGQPFKIDLEGCTPEERAALRSMLERTRGESAGADRPAKP